MNGPLAIVLGVLGGVLVGLGLIALALRKLDPLDDDDFWQDKP